MAADAAKVECGNRPPRGPKLNAPAAPGGLAARSILPPRQEICYRWPAASERWSHGAMPKATPATQALRKLGIAFKLHTYIYDSTVPSGGIGLQAAEALGIEPSRMLKTLMAEVDGNPVCVVVPSDCEVSMKKLAAALGGKSANMMRPADAERLTGYHVGGISPFGQKKRVPVAIERAAMDNLTVFVNGGQRGLQIEIDPNDAAIAAGAVAHALTV
jgi:Cys-tRNA(Pro)/Cys-tRNA(Cys) deacylase